MKPGWWRTPLVLQDLAKVILIISGNVLHFWPRRIFNSPPFSCPPPHIFWYLGYLSDHPFIKTLPIIWDWRVKTFRVISNEIPVLLLILCWCCFGCLKMYSEKFFNAYFYEQMFLKIFVERETQFSAFQKIIAWAVKFSLTNLHVTWRSWF